MKKEDYAKVPIFFPKRPTHIVLEISPIILKKLDDVRMENDLSRNEFVLQAIEFALNNMVDTRGIITKVTSTIYSVYMHRNEINNKVYIGVTKAIPESRWGKDGNGYKGENDFWNDIQKYGWENFEHTILATCDTQEEAAELELHFITSLHSTDGRYGYNSTIHSYDNHSRSGAGIGRPRVKKPENWDEVYTMWKHGQLTAVEAMEITNLKRSTFYKFAKEEG